MPTAPFTPSVGTPPNATPVAIFEGSWEGPAGQRPGGTPVRTGVAHDGNVELDGLTAGQKYTAYFKAGGTHFTESFTARDSDWLMQGRKAVLAALRDDVRASYVAAAMATPPTLTWSDTNTTIAGSVLIDMTDSRFRYSGSPPITTAAIYYGPRAAATVADVANAGSSVTPLRAHFATDAQNFEIPMRPRTALRMRIMVDGQWNVITPTVPTTTDDTNRLLKVAFTTKEMRDIVVEMQGNGTFFGGVRILPSDTLSRSLKSPGVRAFCIADSYGVGVSGSGNDPLLGYFPTAMRLLGIDDIWQAPSAGGSGFLADSSGTVQPYGKRLIPDVLPYLPTYQPALLSVGASINDINQGYTPAQIAAAADAYLVRVLNAIRPGDLVVLKSAMYAAGGAAHRAATVALAAIAAKRGVPFIDSITSADSTAWYFGSGASGAVTGDGNADIYRASDLIHPSPAGHVYGGQREYRAMLRVLNGEMVVT